MRRLMVVLALGAALGLGAGAPAASAQMGYDPYAGGYGYGYAAGTPYGYAGGAPYAFNPAFPIGPYAAGPYGAGGYGGLPGYGGVPYGTFAAYASPLATGAYSPTGYPTFGAFPYYALNGNTTNPSPYGYYNPYAMFFGCTSTYTASNFYVCR